MIALIFRKKQLWATEKDFTNCNENFPNSKRMSLYEQTVGLHLFLKASDLKDLKLNFNEFFSIQYFVLK